MGLFSGDNICNAHTHVCLIIFHYFYPNVSFHFPSRCRSRKKCKFIVAGHFDCTNLNWRFQASLEREFDQIRLELQLVMRRWHGLRQALEIGLHCCWLLINFDWRCESWEICRLQNAFCADNLISLNVNSIIPDLWRWFCPEIFLEWNNWRHRQFYLFYRSKPNTDWKYFLACSETQWKRNTAQEDLKCFVQFSNCEGLNH